MRKLIVVLLVALGSVASAEALTLRDVIELSKAGLSDDVLVALVEVERPVFPIDRETLQVLKDAGVSEKVMIAMIRSGRMQSAAETPPLTPDPPQAAASDPIYGGQQSAPAPQVIVLDHHDTESVQQVAVPVPIYIPFVPTHRTHDRGVQLVTPPSPFYTGQVRPAEPVKDRARNKAPVYWGHGGKLRPDAWGQPRKK